MFSYFLDTSAYAKLYHQEEGSQLVENLLDQPAWTVVVSRLSLVEIESVIAIKVRTGELDVAGQEFSRRRIRADISQGRIRVGPPIYELHFLRARRLLVKYGVSMALRTLDALHLAAALSASETEFVSNDNRQRAAAVALGLTVLP